MTNKSYIGDIGTRIRTYLFTSLVGNTKIEYRLLKPDESTVTWTCTVEDIDEGVIYYDTIEDDFDIAGQWDIQAYVEFSNGNRYLSQTKQFVVYEAYK